MYTYHKILEVSASWLFSSVVMSDVQPCDPLLNIKIALLYIYMLVDGVDNAIALCQFYYTHFCRLML